MTRPMILWTALALLFLLLAGLAWALGQWSFAASKAYVDGLAPDGSVETWDVAFHRRVQGNLRWLAALLAGMGLAVAGGQRLLASSLRPERAGWSGFMADVRSGIRKVNARTSGTHKRVVWALILAGAALRIWQMRQPVIYDEAFTYTYYATRPLSVIISDYSYPNNQVFHTLLVKLTTSLFGVHLWSLRLPALIAGILTLPLSYLFARITFNRYIAMIMLALVASCGSLIEYSALGRGYSITWCCMIVSWIIGRHLTKTNNGVSAVLLAVVLAVGMWTVTSTLYIAAATYIWLFLQLILRYGSTLGTRMYRSILSVVLFLVITALFYLPVIVVHGLGQLFHHPTMGDNTWEVFSATHHERSLDLWVYFTETSASWIAFVGFAAITYAAYISSKYRMLIVATALGAIPIVIAQSLVAPPRVWIYTLFVMHLGSAIGLFYLLKLLQDTGLKSFGKRFRTVLTSLLIFVGMGWLGMRGIRDRIDRFPEAALAADHFKNVLVSGDRVFTDFPWEAPLEFHFMAARIPRGLLYTKPSPRSALYVMVGPAAGQTPESVLLHHELTLDSVTVPDKVMDWKRLEIFAARLRDDATAGDAR
ncbi:MAG: glycosyltransferase family 39 protein [Flavobacteriales bacterium]|nr:glycosyltransferase family 39 protein [Flavobacteriales bacterium]